MRRMIELVRTEYRSDCTLGRLIVTGDKGIHLFECVTLELPWRRNMVRTSCIPTGRYAVELERSQALRADLWELKGVPGRSEIKIHAANYVAQLRGCIAPGLRFTDLNADGTIDVASSRVALVRFMSAMGDVQRSVITITDER